MQFMQALRNMFLHRVQQRKYLNRTVYSLFQTEENRCHLYRVIMKTERNRLRISPSGQRFQLMIFSSVIWTTIFTASTTLYVWYGKLGAGHFLLALGIVITGSTFRLASGVTQKVSNQIRFMR